MKIQLDDSSNVPVFQQIVDQVHFAINTGELKPGDKLPSIRKIAAENQIASNLDTVSRRAAFYEEAASMIAALSADASSGAVPSVQGQNDTAATGPAARIKPRVKPEPNG